MDTETQNALINVASLVVTSGTAIALAWIAYKQNVLSKKQDAIAAVVDDVKKQTDGINSKLVDATGRASHAEGELKGRAESQTRQDAIDVGVAKTTPLANPTVRTAELAVLKKTELNTAATAESAAQTADNTAKTEASAARTEAQVQELKKE